MIENKSLPWVWWVLVEASTKPGATKPILGTLQVGAANEDRPTRAPSPADRF